MSTTLQVTLRHALSPRLVGHPWWPRALGLVAVLMFAWTLPMTRLANGTVADPQWPPLFVASARAALAGLLAMAHLRWAGASRPTAAQLPWLAGVVLGGVMGFPLGMGWAVRVVPAAHAAVITGLLPLCTAALAAWWLGHRPPWPFWAIGATAAGLMAGFALLSHSAASMASAQAWWADGVLLLGMLGAAVAYVSGARLAREMPAAQVMSWALVLAWPVTLTLAVHWWPAHLHSLGQARLAVRGSAWAGLAYVAVGSSWLGFFFWYAALARDAMRVSQLQLLQPLLAMLASAWCLGEVVPPFAWAFAILVLLLVGWGQRFARGVAPARSSLPTPTPTPPLPVQADLTH